MLSGVLALALLEAATSSTQAAGRIGDLFDGIASIISHVLSPAVPAIPDLRTKGGDATNTSDESSGSSDSSGSSEPRSNTVPPDWTTSPKSLFV